MQPKIQETRKSLRANNAAIVAADRNRLVKWICASVRQSEGAADEVDRKLIELEGGPSELIKKLGHDEVVKALLEASYTCLDAERFTKWAQKDLRHFADPVQQYLEVHSPKYWSIPLLELIAMDTDASSEYYQYCDWHHTQGTESQFLKFKSFVKGPVRVKSQTIRFYNLIHDMFILSSELLYELNIRTDERGRLMQGVIEQGKKRIFLKGFSRFMNKLD